MSHKINIPLISIIVPVYNTEEYIIRCLNSIINQSFKNIEIIISNDLSTDNSEAIILEYVKKYKFIKYFKMKSKGLAGGARNLGLANASGKYVGFVDSDDWIDTMMYEKMINLSERANADIALCGVIREYENIYNAELRYEYKIENVLEGQIALDILTRSYNQDISISSIVCNKIYRLDFLKKNKILFLSNSYSEDDIFNFLCFIYANKIAITPNTYYHYYQRNNSTTHTFSKKHIDDLVKGFVVLKKYLEKNNLYEINKKNYYSFFEKTLGFLLGVLMTTEQKSEKQNEYIIYLLAKSNKLLILEDYIDYIGIQRLRKFLTPGSIK